jgi:hypothetical protein
VTYFYIFQQTREQRQAKEMAQLLEEIDLTEDKNNGYESDDSIDFETQ